MKKLVSSAMSSMKSHAYVFLRRVPSRKPLNLWPLMGQSALVIVYQSLVLQQLLVHGLIKLRRALHMCLKRMVQLEIGSKLPNSRPLTEISISGNLVIVGAYVDDNEATNSGSVYVFEKDESTGLWFETAKLIASDREAGDQFGLGVSISGEIAVVGAFAEDENGHDSGSA